jgi:glycosyltransferase involved in cell wall biosynthesis
VTATSRPLRVAVDLTQVDNQTLGSGQFRYAVDLVNGLCALDAIDLTLLGSGPLAAEDFRASIDRFPQRCHYAPLPPYRGRGSYYYDITRLSWWLAAHRIDVFHQLHTNIPAVRVCPVVTTVYHYFDDPALFATRPYRYYRWALRRRVDLVVTISDATRDDFHRRVGVPLERMRTVYPGLSRSFGAPPAAVSGPPYLLSPYNLSSPKNLRSLIAAWPAIAAGHPDLELRLYGRAHVTPQREAEFERMLQGLPGAGRIHRTGHVSDGELAALYEGCAVFVFPTTVEGFGYPLLEAMAHGAPCVARNASAMAEIGGDAVVLVETLDPDEIARAANALLDDPPRRADLGARARRRAAPFTVEAMARATLECYCAVSARPAARPR